MLLFLLWLIITDSEGTPAPGTNVYQEIGPFAVLSMTGKGISRASGPELETRNNMKGGINVIPGIDPDKQKIIDQPGTVDDGLMCATGQGKWSEAEAAIVKKFAEDQLYAVFGVGEHLISGQGNFENSYQSTNERYGSNCKSGICSFDVLHYTGICGPLPPRSFPDDLSCIDGSTPMSEEKFKDLREEFQRKGVGPSFVISEGTEDQIEDWNREAQQNFGKNCKSGKCYYDDRRGSYRCGKPSSSSSSNSNSTNSLRPSLLILILTLVLLLTLVTGHTRWR
jgi:hypothetical protein